VKSRHGTLFLPFRFRARGGSAPIPKFVESQKDPFSLQNLSFPNDSDVDFKDGDFQFGICPIYRPNGDTLGSQIGNWWWDWAVQRGSDYSVYYGTMMIEWNVRESIAFGFSSTQSYWPVTGGFLSDNSCPHGYVRFDRSTDGGDTRFYKLYLCGEAC